jgi:hypothetical protein
MKDGLGRYAPKTDGQQSTIPGRSPALAERQPPRKLPFRFREGKLPVGNRQHCGHWDRASVTSIAAVSSDCSQTAEKLWKADIALTVILASLVRGDRLSISASV